MADKKVLDELVSKFHVDLGKHKQVIVCPLHNDKAPSLAIWLAPPGDEHVHCFGCGFHGSLVRFLAAVDGVSVGKKLNQLGIKRDSKADALDRIVDIFAEQLEKGETICTSGEKMPAVELLVDKRGHDIKLLKNMRIGVATESSIELILKTIPEKDLRALKIITTKGDTLLTPVGAITFPVIIAGDVVGLRWKRYSLHKLVPKEVAQIEKKGWVRFVYLYNYDALIHETDNLFVVEGEDDVLRILAAGGTAIGFPGGITPRDKRLNYLKNCPAKRIIIAVDNDKAGEKYRDYASKFMKREGKEGWVYVPESNDIADDLNALSLEEIIKATKELAPEFRESQGAYYEGNVKISTFVIDLKAKVVGEDEVYIVIEIRGEKEPEAQTIVLPNRLIADKGEFNKFLKRQGCYAWLSSGTALDDLITRKWKPEMPVHYAINYYGALDMSEYEEDSNLHAYVLPERMYLPGNNTKESDDGILWLDDHHGIYPQVAGKTPHSMDGIVPSMDAFADLRKLVSRKAEYTIILGWFLAIPWMREIQKRVGGFPLAWVSGEQGSGKTTFVSFLLGLYYPVDNLKDDRIDAFLGTSRTTPEGVSNALARYSGLPVFLDDVRTNSKYAEEYMELMRVLYDRFSIQKGRLKIRDSFIQAYEARKMRAALVVTSQHPPEDEALNQRTLEIELKKTYLQNESFYEMQAMVKSLFPIGLYFMNKSLNESIPELDIAMKILGPESVRSRKLQAYAIASTGLLKAGYTETEVSKLIRKMNVSHDKMSYESDEIEEFFDYIRTAMSAKAHEVNRFLGWREEGYWMAPSNLYDLTAMWHRGKAAFTKRSIKRLLKAQPGLIHFQLKTGIKDEKPVSAKVGDDRFTTVRGIFFQYGSEMAERIKSLSTGTQETEDDYAESFTSEELEQTQEEGPPSALDEEF